MDVIEPRDPAQVAQDVDQWIDGWSEKMIEIWREKQLDLDVHDTGALAQSMTADAMHEGLSAHIVLEFLQYGAYQAMGVGRGYIHGNGGDLQFLNPVYREEHHLNEPRKRGPKWGGGYTSGEPRRRRDWITPKLYASVLKMAEVMAQLTGQMGVAMVCDALENVRSALRQSRRSSGGSAGGTVLF